MPKRLCRLPATFLVDLLLERNPIFEIDAPEIVGEFEVIPFTRGKRVGELVSGFNRTVIVLPKRAGPEQASSDEVLITPDGKAPSPDAKHLGRWVTRPQYISAYDKARLDQACKSVRNSWKDQFTFVEEAPLEGGGIREGLRPPQTGALHSAIGHWKMSDEVATVVMPTGTGKTETMVAVCLHERPERLLVVVPSDTLRTQIAHKFMTLGLLRRFGVCGPNALHPVVGILKHGLSSHDRMHEFFQDSNVIVSTMSLLASLPEEEQKLCASLCTHLFIDEAHHIRAKTWEAFRSIFERKSILQFTATPFRNDGAHVDGRVVFNYPLGKAQAEGYFTQLNLLPVEEFDQDQADDAIAKAAVEQLRKDLEKGHDHLMMARTSTIQKATDLLTIYEKVGSAFKPVVIHSELSQSEKTNRLNQIERRESRIIVCVDMFGEGFDLPELKIAALHDTHKSLAITLQFTGRFARTKKTIGEATIVVNIADQEVDDSLRELYSEDADWNQILKRMSEGATEEQIKKQQFLDDFTPDSRSIPVQNLTPKMSAVIYRTHCSKWKPQRIADAFPPEVMSGTPAINAIKNVAYIVVREESEVEWGEMREFTDRSFDLYVLYWDADRNLLFINTSNNEAPHEQLAKAVVGEDAELIKGTTVFRSFSGLNRVLLQTLGLTHVLGRVIRFTMHVGADVPAGLSEAQTENKVKTNIFASGFADGDRVTVGCSRKGRIWSRRVANDVLEWVGWCKQMGAKMDDATFSEEEILKHSIVPEDIDKRPNLMPLAIEWPDEFYALDKTPIQVHFDKRSYDFQEVGLALVKPDLASPIQFRLYSTDESSEYEIRFSKTHADYMRVSGQNIDIVIGKRRKSLSDWFLQYPPIVRFEQDSFTKDNQLCRPHIQRSEPFDLDQIEAWAWSGVNLKRESQTEKKLTDSIQYYVIQKLKQSEAPLKYDVIFDDDDTHEAADVVAIALKEHELLVHLFHCKYSQESSPGARVKDLFEVCGQAQKSVQWRSHVDRLLKHLIQRDVSRVNKKGVSRFEVGSRKTILGARRKLSRLQPQFKVFIVQPGLSKGEVTSQQLELLGATKLYLKETYQMPLTVIASA
jgi:superfamily II DNA or RNA helicase